ncbi:MAG TPA: CRTAC1 family protein [Flavobacteriales bacterium]|nr:CRTAC1 family protein [Flavobacteriales bacterium]
MVLAAVQGTAQVTFQNVAPQVGLDYLGRSYGSSWGDIDGDGWMDLFMSCHQNKTEPFFKNDSIRIYKNLGGAGFDFSIYMLDDGHQSDFHGGIFFDHDNDGDQDLLLLTGGTKRNVFLRNDGGTHLVDRALEVGLGLNKSRGRQGTVLDVDNDGVLDLIMNHQAPFDPLGVGTVLMQALPGPVYAIRPDLGFAQLQSAVSCISDLDGDGRTDVVVANMVGLDIYSIDESGQFAVRNQISIPNVLDITIADFNGDLLPDIFVARGLTQVTDIRQANDSVILASCEVGPDLAPCTGEFSSDGMLEIGVLCVDIHPIDLHIGTDGLLPQVLGSLAEPYYTITLDPADVAVEGWQELSSLPPGLRCSFGKLGDAWHFMIGSTGPLKSTVIMQVRSTAPITGFSSVGTPQPGEESRDLLLLNQGEFQFQISEDPAFDLMEYSISAIAGDLDNDMDVDLVVLATGRTGGRKCHLYENLGDGTFAVHENGWGLKGDVAGISESITVADYDNDGFLDLFVANGGTAFFLDSAALQLYRNQANANHWTTIDLRGTQSNADGIGAVVTVFANGRHQVANRTGGVHVGCQDDRRLHFGLGDATVVDTIRVQWPSGVVDVFTGQQADAILVLEEGTGFSTGALQTPGQAMTDLASLIARGQVERVVVYDTQGRLVGQREAIAGREWPQPGELAAGMYLLYFQGHGGQVLAVRKYMAE